MPSAEDQVINKLKVAYSTGVTDTECCGDTYWICSASLLFSPVVILIEMTKELKCG